MILGDAMKYDEIIIGSGLGGLTAAALLAKKKKKVLVLEQHFLAGGCATGYKRKGINIEVGLHEMDLGTPYLDMKHLIFKKLGLDKRIELVSLPQTWTIKDNDSILEIPHGHKNAERVLCERFPHEKSGIKRYFRKLRLTSYCIRRLPWDLNILEFFIFPIAVFPVFLLNIIFPQKSVGEVLDECIKDDALKDILNANVFYFHDNPYKFIFQYHAMAQSSYYNSAVFIKGGSQVLSDTLVDIIRENGGEVRLSCDVTKINVENKKVQSVVYYDKKLKQEVEVNTRKVIANCAPSIVYNTLLPDGYQDPLLGKLKNSVSLYTIYIIFKRNFSQQYSNTHYSTFMQINKEMNNEFYKKNEDLRSIKVEDRNFVFVDYSTIDSGLVPEGDDRSFGVITSASYLDEWESLDADDYNAKNN